MQRSFFGRSAIIGVVGLAVLALAGGALAGGNEAPFTVPLEKQEPVMLGSFEAKPVIDG